MIDSELPRIFLCAKIIMTDFEYVSQVEAIGSNIGPKPPLDLSHHFSRVTAARKASSVKRFYKYFQIPGIAQLAGGKFDTLYLQEWDIRQC